MNEQLLISELNKSRNGFLTQKEKEWISEAPKEVPHPEELPNGIISNPVFDQEFKIVKLLILNGHKDKDGYANLAEFIFEKFAEYEIEFEHEIMKIFITEIKKFLLENVVFNTETFTNNSNQIISSYSANLIVEKHEMSLNWVKKYDIIMDPPEVIFLKDIESTLNHLVKSNLIKLQDKLNKEFEEMQQKDDFTEISLYMKMHILIKERIKEVALKIGNVISY
jgi:hypothetical protein